MPSISELLKNTAVRIALAVVAVIAVVSLAYYLLESAPPKITYVAVAKGTISDDITADGTVSPVQNPTLSFETGGQVRSVFATVGQSVAQGTLLASLDTSVLAANLEAAQAKLDEMEAGPRSVDVAGQQTAVTSAQQDLSNAYTNYVTTLQSTFANAQGAVNNDANPSFNLSDPTDPALNYETLPNAAGVRASSDLAQLAPLFTQWQSELSALPASPTQAQLEAATTDSLAHLQQIQAFFTDLITALNAVPVGNASQQAQVSADLSLAHSGLSTVNGLISSLQTSEQGLTTQQLAVTSAQDQLNDTLAGSTAQDVQAQQAAVAAIEAQIAQEEVIAPFAGTIASVNVKAGDVVSATTPAITLIPQGNFEVDVYVAENDLPHITVGNPADITLDAYGTSRVFPATVSAIDTSPSAEPDGTQGYMVTLIFTNADPAIVNGMHANATIHAGSAQGVLIIPNTAVITSGTKDYVLKETSSGPVQVPVTLGLSNATDVEVTSGLSEGDQISAVGSQ